MKGTLLQDEVKAVEAEIKKFEINTGCELLVVFAQASDEYPGASWRFGVIGGFVLTFLLSFYVEFSFGYIWPMVMIILTLFMTWIGHFDWAKKVTLSDTEVDSECFEKALEYFHTLGTSQVSHKVTAMIMVSILEKEIIVLVDEKLKKEISQDDLNELVTIMKKHFQNHHMGEGFIQSIQSLEEKILRKFKGKVIESNISELKDTIHFV